jgi:hypothetical protein
MFNIEKQLNISLLKLFLNINDIIYMLFFVLC